MDQLKVLLNVPAPEPEPVAGPEVIEETVPEAEVVPEIGEANYEDMDRQELMAAAKARGLKVNATMKTVDIIQAIKDHDALS